MSRKPLSVQAQQDRLRRKRREAGEVLTIFRKPLKESLTSVLPITAIVLVLCFTITPISNNAMMAFLLGSLLLIVGMGLFTLGSEMSMIPLGEAVGKEITRSKKVWVIVAISFLIGVIITVAEPDLQVLAGQVPSIPDRVIIWSVALGVGVFLVIALLRILFAIQLSYLLIGFYAIVFVLAGFVSPDFWAVAFDSGGVTTGPMTVPFIMALGVGVSAVRNDREAGGDSFGLVALCSIGPIITVLLLGLLYQPDGSTYTPVSVPDAKDTAEMFRSYTHALPEYFKEIFLSLAPILAFFVLFQLVTRRMHRREVMSMLFGLLYTYIGLVLFLTGVNVGFMPVGSFLGESIAAHESYSWLLIPIAMLIGYFIVSAEPAVHVLNRQVEEITAGAIPASAMNAALSIGVSVSLALAMIRVLTGISIMWFLIPGYVLSLALSFVVPKIFTSIAFDSGGVASGPMTATFLLPFAMGACDALGGNVVTDAFGVVAMVAMTPLVTIQLLGVSYQRKLSKRTPVPAVGQVEEIIEAGIGGHMKRLYLMITITNRVIGSKRFVDFYRAFGAPVVFTALGRGTASDEVLSYLGLEATEKSVMLSVVTPACKEVLMKELVTTMHLTNPGTGIAMCLPLSSIGGRTAMNYLITGNPEAEPDVEVKEDESMKDAAYQLIVAIANQGYTDTVMGAARSAGAHGGTILHAKSTGAEDAGKFFGMSIAEEREIILMVVPTGDKNTVMQAIMAQAGAHTEAQAVTFSVALEDVAGLYHINADE